MTNLFGINITENKENNIFDGDIFCTRCINDYQEKELEEIILNGKEFEEKSSLKFPFSLIKTLSQFGWTILSIGIIKSWGDGTPLAQGYKNAPEIFWACPICFIIWLILHIISVNLKNKTKNSIEFQELNESSEQFFKKVKETLCIPDEATEIDVLVERYILKNNEPKHKNFDMTGYDNYTMFMYINEDKLCLSNVVSVWEIPVSSFKKMELIKKRVSFPEWNKNEPYNSEKYSQYKITTNQFGHYFSRYYRVEISDMLGDFYLLIPEYDGNSFAELTDIKQKGAGI